MMTEFRWGLFSVIIGALTIGSLLTIAYAEGGFFRVLAGIVLVAVGMAVVTIADD